MSKLVAPTEFTDEFLAWEEADDRPRATRPASDWIWSGSPDPQRGRLLGGNLDTLTGLLATPYLPDLTGAVLLLETTGDRLDIASRELSQLRQAGVFDAVRAVVLGRCFRCPPTLDDDLHQAVRAAAPDGLPAGYRTATWWRSDEWSLRANSVDFDLIPRRHAIATLPGAIRSAGDSLATCNTRRCCCCRRATPSRQRRRGYGPGSSRPCMTAAMRSKYR